ncbi:MAG: hypothetical protein IPL10_10660 [Bacteroidetes bacterium]|nr:hypothetical protein [Bacteroidota bacterium]
MIDVSNTENQIHFVTNFEELVSTAFVGEVNAICWRRKLVGDFSEIIKKVKLNSNIIELNKEQLLKLELSEQGQLARELILNDFELLKTHGASPTLNIIKCYEKDESFFPTDVYSFHVDRSPVPTDTFLCTYFGEASDILPNAQAQQKVLVPEIRDELKKLYDGKDEDFESFLTEHFFDLHYQPKPTAQIINLGIGHLWRLAVDHPQSKVLPCVHRAPNEKAGENRLLMIC